MHINASFDGPSTLSFERGGGVGCAASRPKTSQTCLQPKQTPRYRRKDKRLSSLGDGVAEAARQVSLGCRMLCKCV